MSSLSLAPRAPSSIALEDPPKDPFTGLFNPPSARGAPSQDSARVLNWPLGHHLDLANRQFLLAGLPALELDRVRPFASWRSSTQERTQAARLASSAASSPSIMTERLPGAFAPRRRQLRLLFYWSLHLLCRWLPPRTQSGTFDRLGPWPTTRRASGPAELRCTSARSSDRGRGCRSCRHRGAWPGAAASPRRRTARAARRWSWTR